MSEWKFLFLFFHIASITSFLTVLAWYPNTLLRTWCLVLHSLTLMTNMQLNRKFRHSFIWRGKRGFPAAPRERPRESFFNASRGPSPLPWLESHDALPLAMRMESWLPWRRTRGSLRSPSCLGRNPTLAPQLKKTHETPPLSWDEGHH